MADNSTAAVKTVKTVWEVWAYDVWGNAEDGYSVNNRFCVNRAFEAEAIVKVYNAGTPQQFESAELSDDTIRAALGIKGEFTDSVGDDTHYYPESEDDGYPLGELFCVSHSSLSPIREVENMAEVIEAQRNIRY